MPEYMIKGVVTYRLLIDQGGSVRLVLDSAGNVAERIDYDEFGNVLADSAPGLQPFGFAGGVRDPDTGLTRFGARDYDPGVGRWTSKDQTLFDGGSANIYEYVQGDPINFIDPKGEEPISAAAEFSVGEIGPAVETAIGETAGLLGTGAAIGGAFLVGWEIGAALHPYVTDYIQNALDHIFMAEHTKNTRPSNWDTHSKTRPGAPRKVT